MSVSVNTEFAMNTDRDYNCCSQPKTPEAIVQQHVNDLSRPEGNNEHGALSAGAAVQTKLTHSVSPIIVTDESFLADKLYMYLCE